MKTVSGTERSLGDLPERRSGGPRFTSDGPGVPVVSPYGGRRLAREGPRELKVRPGASTKKGARL
jgi:hypothetical protein